MFEKVSYEQFKKDMIKFYNNLNIPIDTVDIKSDYNNIRIPIRSTKDSVGYDFFSPIELKCFPGSSYILPTGIKWNCTAYDIYDHYKSFLALYPRSSYGIKYGFTILNTVGIIDKDYYNNPDNEGEIFVAFKTDGMTIDKGNKFCQGIPSLAFTMYKEIPVVTERKGGIGSTKK